MSLLKVWSLLLIAASLRFMSTGMYKLSIKPDAKQIGPVCINSFDDLKYILLSFFIVVHVIQFLELPIMLGTSRQPLEIGTAIALVIVAGGWVFCNSIRAWRR